MLSSHSPDALNASFPPELTPHLHAKHFLLKHAPLIKSPTLVVGCGKGGLAAFITTQFQVETHGVDPSKEHIEYASQHYGQANLHFHRCELQSLHYKSEINTRKYATIVSTEALQKVSSHLHRIIFWNIRHFLREEDGVALFLIPSKSQLLMTALDETMKSAHWQKHFTHFPNDEAKNYESPAYYHFLCMRAGFFHCEVDAHYEDLPKTLSAEEVKEFLRSVAQVAHLRATSVYEGTTNALVEKFLTDVVDRYFQKTNKAMSEKVSFVSAHTKILAYATEASFFKSKDHHAQQLRKQEKHSKEETLHLTAKL